MSGTKEPSGPRQLPLLGNTHQWIRDPCEFKTRAAEEHDRVVHFNIFSTDTYLLTEPEDIERVFVEHGENFQKHRRTNEQKRKWLGQGLVTSDGELWRRQRKALQPAFYMDQIKSHVDSMVGRARDATDRWHDGQTVNMMDEMNRTMLEIIVESMFGEDIQIAERGLYQAVEEMKGPLKPKNQPITFLAPDWAPIPFLKRSIEARDHIRSEWYDLIEERRRSDEDRHDLLALMLKSDTEMSDEQICDEMMTFLLGGHDTTALTMTYTLDLLSRHPEVGEKLRAEIDETVDGKPGFEDIPELSYTENVVKESMRLYPAGAHELRREVVQDVTFGDYHVPAGSMVVQSAWVTHRDERFWGDPDTFRPERWDEDADRPEFAYFPFAGGPRRCIGAQFAMLEAQLVLSTLAKDWTFEREYDELELSATITLKPKNDVEMTVRRR